MSDTTIVKERAGATLSEFIANTEVTEIRHHLGVAAGGIDKLRESGNGYSRSISFEKL